MEQRFNSVMSALRYGLGAVVYIFFGAIIGSMIALVIIVMTVSWDQTNSEFADYVYDTTYWHEALTSEIEQLEHVAAIKYASYEAIYRRADDFFVVRVAVVCESNDPDAATALLNDVGRAVAIVTHDHPSSNTLASIGVYSHDQSALYNLTLDTDIGDDAPTFERLAEYYDVP